jgi:hypothetical protein
VNPDSHDHPSPPEFVAQICNLLYRRFSICGVSGTPGRQDSHNALPTTSRPYGRLKTCATHLGRLCKRSTGGFS